MKGSHSQTMVLVGAFGLMFPLGLPSYYGNMLPYLASYFLARRAEMTYMVDPLWPSTVYMFSMPVIMVFTSPLERRFGIRRCLTAAVVLSNVSVLSGYFTIREPLAFTLTFGVLQGIGVGAIYALTYKQLMTTWSERGAFSAGIAESGTACGSLMTIGLSYLAINPLNLKADLKIDKTLYFSDPSIIHRVPFLFLVMGSVFSVVSITSLVLIYIATKDISPYVGYSLLGKTSNSLDFANNDEDKYPTMPLKRIGNENTRHILKAREVNTGDGGTTERGATSLDHFHTDHIQNTPHHKSLNSRGCETYCEDDSKSERLSIAHTSKPTTAHHERESSKNVGDNSERDSESDFLPLEMLRTHQFWIAWAFFILLTHSSYVHINLYKQYGQLAVPDDAALVTAGLLSTAGMAVTRPMIGLLADRIGSPQANLAVAASSSVIMSAMVVGVHTCPPLYFVVTVLGYLTLTTPSVLNSLLVVFLFGRKYSASNLGILYTGNPTLMAVEPPFISFLLRHFGWDWVFLSGAFSAAAAVLCMLYMIAIGRPTRP